jgi:hypothetical protein
MKNFALLAILVTLIYPLNAENITPLTELRVCASGCPYTTVQAAIDAAEPDDVIQIATGTYTGLNDLGGLRQIAYITKSLTLIGGYNPDFSIWDPTLYPTTLDAGSGGRVIYASGTIDLTLEGLRLTDGNATGLGGEQYYDDDAGGAVYLSGGELTMTNCIVENSIASDSARSGHYAAAGGGLYIASSQQVTLTGNTFQNNIAATVAGDYMGLGGGIAIYNSNAVLEGNTITGNIGSTLSAGNGGGLYLIEGTTELNDNTISFNTASESTAQFYSAGEGGGIYAVGDLTMTGNTISDNEAGYEFGNGGGIYLIGGYIFTLTDNLVLRNRCNEVMSEWKRGDGGGLYILLADATLTDNLIQDNVAGERGGGLYLDESSSILTGNTIQDNSASEMSAGSGGGLYLADSPATLTNNLISGNIATNARSTAGAGAGGGLYLENSAATLTGNRIENNRASIAWEYGGGRGGGVYLEGSPAELIQNQITGNIACMAHNDTGFGGGLYVQNSGASLTRNLIYDNTAGLMDNGYGGGAYIEGYYGPAPILDGNTIVHNMASFHSLEVDGYGGGVAVYRRQDASFILHNNVIADNDADDDGGGLWVGGLSETQPVGGLLYHNTIANNRGGGAAVSVRFATSLEMTDNIISGHSLGVYAVADSAITMNATLWYENTLNTGGEGSITHTDDYSGDPLYADPMTWNYHLTPGSAALDTAVDAGVLLDMDAQPRPNPDTNLPDLGADEFYCTPPASVTIDGPATAPVGFPISLTAHAEPGDTLLPLTYTWEAIGQEPVIHQGGLDDAVSFTWQEIGEKEVTVTVANACGAPVTDTYTILIESIVLNTIYLPLILR